jgi:hypothetical protein
MTFALTATGTEAATMTVGEYQLRLDGHCVDELREACTSLLDALAHGETAVTDADIRPQLPGVPSAAHLQAWMFPCFLVWMPVLVFATEGARTAIYTRTVSEEPGMPLVVLPERDLQLPVIVETETIVDAATNFLKTAQRGDDSGPL